MNNNTRKSYNSLSQQLADLNRLYANALSVINAIETTITSDQNIVSFAVQNPDGSTQTLQLPSNNYIFSELEALKSTVTNVIASGEGAVVSSDGQYREIYLSDYRNAQQRLQNSELDFDNKIILEDNPIIETLNNPSSTISVELPSRLQNCKRAYIIKVVVDTEGYDILTDGLSYTNTLNLLKNNGFSYSVSNILTDTTPRVARYAGTFDVLKVSVPSTGYVNLTVTNLTYNDIYSAVNDSRQLDTGDYVTTINGSSKWVVERVIGDTLVKLKRVSGLGSIEVGEDKLMFLDTPTSGNIKIPVRGSERFMLFLAPIDKFTGVLTEYSEGKKIDSGTYTIVEDDVEYTFDQYFNDHILSIGSYLENLISENKIQAQDGFDVPTPTLKSDYFTVVQINKHVTSTISMKRLENLKLEKSKTRSELDILNSKISEVNNRLIKSQYRSTTEKTTDELKLTSLVTEKSTKQKLFSSTVTEMTSVLQDDTSFIVNPKYRIRGFWITEDAVEDGVTQQVVQYNVKYRYRSVESAATEATVISIDNQTGIISNWVNLKTEPLVKQYNTTTQKFEWYANLIGSIDQTNPNQLDIPITKGEIVDIQIQAISEAGYPETPVLSDWSNIIAVEFPSSLNGGFTTNELFTQHTNDIALAKIDEELTATGIEKHLEDSFFELDAYLAHVTSKIATKYRTDENKTINLETFLDGMKTDVQRLSELVERRYLNLTAEIIDIENDKTYPINNLTNIKLFAGNYTENVDLTIDDNFGNIVEKTFYLKLINNNAQGVEIMSISPGDLGTKTTNVDYVNSWIGSPSDTDVVTQKNAQIIYLRNSDLTGNEDLYVERETTLNTFAVGSDIDDSVESSQHNAVQYKDGIFQTIKIKDTASTLNYVVISKQHPIFKDYLVTPSQENKNLLIEVFERASKYSNIYRDNKYQYNSDSINQSGYMVDDKYLIGRNAVGAQLFLNPIDITSIQVPSARNDSAIMVHAGETNALLIPLVFQYRMSDIFGRPNALAQTTISGASVKYTKKIGIDMLMANESFRFDVEVSANFKPSTISNITKQSTLNTITTNSGSVGSGAIE